MSFTPSLPIVIHSIIHRSVLITPRHPGHGTNPGALAMTTVTDRSLVTLAKHPRMGIAYSHL